MTRIDRDLKQMVEAELKDEPAPIAFAAAYTDFPLRQPFLALIPVAFLGFTLLSLATGTALFAMLSAAIFVFGAVLFATKHRNYLIVPAQKELVVMQVSQNLLRHKQTSRWLWRDVEAHEYGSGANLGVEISPKAGGRLKLRFYTKLAKLPDGEERMNKVLALIAEQKASRAATASV